MISIGAVSRGKSEREQLKTEVSVSDASAVDSDDHRKPDDDKANDGDQKPEE